MRNLRQIFQGQYDKGFTVIELLVVFVIISIIAVIGLGSFGSYNASQTFGNGVSEFSNFLSITRSKSISQVKPPECEYVPLDGYKVVVTASGTDYEQDAVCGGISYTIIKKKLPTQLIFMAGSAQYILFDVSSGTVTVPGNVIVPAVIRIGGFGNMKSITVDQIGNISVN